MIAFILCMEDGHDYVPLPSTAEKVCVHWGGGGGGGGRGGGTPMMVDD